MATVVLSAVGSAIGGSIGGSVLGVSAAALGQAAGAVAGSLLDQKLMGSGSVAVETGRARSLRIQSSTEGAPIPVVFGRMRVAGQIIWSTRYRENSQTTVQRGTKSSPERRTTSYSYSISLALGLCEGPIQRLGRIWADGQLLDLTGIEHRVYLGDESQMPDPLIEAVEGIGKVPAYRGLSYVVFEDFPVAEFGNRIPQFNFEVFRPPQANPAGEEIGEPLSDLVQAVTISPGTGEFSLDTRPVRQDYPGGGGKYLNVNNPAGVSDVHSALDQLDVELPNCVGTELIVSWFGDDLRCGSCRVEPRIEQPGRNTSPEAWTSAGLTTETARPVSRDANDRVNFGGTPDDGSIIRAIGELKSRGKAVTLYPFLLMDVPAGNGLTDPYGGTEQATFPWRGRITLDTAPGRPGTVDKTPDAAAQVAQFFGTASASDFVIAPGSVTYTGPDEWTWSRFVLHLAALGAASGGIDAICIGTELRGLTTIRSGPAEFPAVEQLIRIAAEVRALLPTAKITYAADWSEYFGYHPKDGSGDVLFHLDPLWADPNIDAVGIDDYTPLSDWRHGTNHADAGAKSVYSLSYLESQIEGGEYFDYYYENAAGRDAQNRLPIHDGAHGEHWVFRAKDIRSWWSSPHHNRIGGVRQPTPTAWVPQSKPIWLTETGCPATDLGANMPNLFFDAKSSESGIPPGSRGARDDEMQRRFLQAKLGYWQRPENNPVSSQFSGPMIPADRVFVWTWDARPWPDFPVRESVWADGPSHRIGHWITGRVTSGSLALVIAEICLRSGLTHADFDVTQVYGSVEGYLLDRTQSAREALQPLLQLHGIDVYESSGVLVFSSRGYAAPTLIEEDWLVAPAPGSSGPIARETDRETERFDQIRLSYTQAENDYRMGAAETRLPDGRLLRVSESSMPVALSGSKAQQVVDRWLSESNRSGETCGFVLPPSAIAVEAGDLVSLRGSGSDEVYRIDRITDANAREAEAIRTDPSLHIPTRARERSIEPGLVSLPGPLDVVIMDLPIADGSEVDHQPWIAATAAPWPGDVTVHKSASGASFEPVSTLQLPATLGRSQQDLPAGAANRWQYVDWLVYLPSGSVTSSERIDVLNGANAIAIQHADGWEIAQFQRAELVDTDLYRLTALLRGQRGTDHLAATSLGAGARVVVLNDAVVPLPLTKAECGLRRLWRVGRANLGTSHPSYVEIDFTSDCAGLRPFAPAHLRAEHGVDGIAVTWVRTSRIGADSIETADVPLAEAHERYRVTIRKGVTVLRQTEVTTPVYVYPSTEQQSDGAAGLIEFAVQQYSAVVGYGTERTVQINV